MTRAWRWWSDLAHRGRRDIVLVVLLLFAYGFFQQHPAWNEFSRYDLVRALVEQGTTQIDSYQDNTGDKAFYAGHWYSDKAPGTALLGVPVYVLLSVSNGLAGTRGRPGRTRPCRRWRSSRAGSRPRCWCSCSSDSWGRWSASGGR